MVKRDSGYLRSFYLSAGAGAVFGIAAAIIYLQLDVSPWHPLLFCAGMALLAGLFSGLAGMGGSTSTRWFCAGVYRNRCPG